MDKRKLTLIFITSACALSLSACVSNSTLLSFERGRYNNYRDLMIAVSQQTKFPSGTPETVKSRYYQCATDFVLSGVSPADLPALDAYARGEREMPVGELNRINAGIESRLGPPLVHGGLERLAPFCPNDVADFQKYPPHE